MGSIYKLVAERRDRNQSIRRKKNARNLNLFKDSLDEVDLRRPALNRNHTLRQRTVSDQNPGQDFLRPRTNTLVGIRKSTTDVSMINIKNQIKDVDSKVATLTCKIDELTKSIEALKSELNKRSS